MLKPTIALTGSVSVAESRDLLDVVRKVARRLMPLIVICYLFAFFDRINISFAKFVSGLLVLAALGFFAAATFDRQTDLLIIALAVMGAGVVASIPAFWTLPPKLLTGAGAASGIAIINTLGQLGGIVSPVMVGRIRDVTGSTNLALYAIGAMSLLCALLLWFGLPEQLRQRDHVAGR
jgi:nitrate/nitrite transporter NarK